MDDSFIQLKGVTKSFGRNKVLNEVDLSIPEGKITGIVGASGEGKSTILKLIASFYKPTSGKILYFRRNINRDILNIKKSFGMAIEEGSFYENLTVYENLIHFGKLYNVENSILKRRVKGIIYFIGLENSSKVLAKNLSLGMKKRLDLACALVHKPSVLVLDEPTADLDPLLRLHMLKLIKKINSHGTTVIFTTQMLEEVDELCDYVAILCKEKIVDEGKIKDVLRKYKSRDMNKLFTNVFSSKKKRIERAKNRDNNSRVSKKEIMENNEFIKELMEANRR